MSETSQLNASYETTRIALHRIAAHILGRRRWDVSGHFGLRVTPGGISTPIFGPTGESVRIAGTSLLRELDGVTTSTPLQGATLRSLATFVSADIDAPFSSGDGTPPIGEPDEPIEIDAKDVDTIADWYNVGWRVLDAAIASLPASSKPAVLQLWPEHFDIGTDVELPSGGRVNLGCSAGDSFERRPYLYVGPWNDARPGDPSYWNASFGAVLAGPDLGSRAEAIARGFVFMKTGLNALGSDGTAG
jgi:hypothetical protein